MVNYRVDIEAALVRGGPLAMADAALQSGSPQNNQRVPTKAEIIELYEQAW